MAHGAVPLVYGAGGPAEIVADGADGRHWRTVDGLAGATAALIADPGGRERLAAAARSGAERYARPAFLRRAAEAVFDGRL